MAIVISWWGYFIGLGRYFSHHNTPASIMRHDVSAPLCIIGFEIRDGRFSGAVVMAADCRRCHDDVGLIAAADFV